MLGFRRLIAGLCGPTLLPHCLCLWWTSVPVLLRAVAQLLSAATTLPCLPTYPRFHVLAGLWSSSSPSCLAAPDKCTTSPAGETVQQVFSRVSVARDELDGPQVDDQGLTQTDSRNIAVADQYINAIPTDVSLADCLLAVHVCNFVGVATRIRTARAALKQAVWSSPGGYLCHHHHVVQAPVAHVPGSLLTSPSCSCCRSVA